MRVQQEPGVVSHPSFPREPLLHSLSLTPPSHCSSKRQFRGVPKTTLRFSKAVILPFLLFYRESSQMKISTRGADRRVRENSRSQRLVVISQWSYGQPLFFPATPCDNTMLSLNQGHSPKPWCPEVLRVLAMETQLTVLPTG